MAFKRLIAFSDWDMLEEALEYNPNKTSCASFLNSGKRKDKNLKGFYINDYNSTRTIHRYFCRCGATHATNKTCKCGNKDWEYLGSTSSRNPLNEGLRYVLNPNDTISLERTTYCFKEDFTTNNLVLEKDEVIDAIFSDKGMNLKTVRSNLDKYDFSDFNKIFSSKYFNVEKLSIFKNYYYNKFKTLDELIAFKNDYPKLFEDFETYPNILTFIFRSDKVGLTKTTTVKSFLEDIDFPKEFYPYAERIFFSRYSSKLLDANPFKDYDKIKTKELKDSIKYIICHNDEYIYHNIVDLISDASDNTADEEEEKLLAKFLLANTTVEGLNVINCYKRRKLFLHNRKLELNEKNIDKRNINQISFLEDIKSSKCNESRADLFLDAFDRNPLKSLTLISSKKALTKEEEKEFLD